MIYALQFSQIGLQAEHFKAANQHNTEWHGPCPRCGGKDRFALFTDREFPSWNGWCRQCGWSGWIDELNTALRVPLTEAQRAEFRARNEARRQQQQAAQRAERQQKLAEIAASYSPDELHAWLNDTHRAWWRSQGVPDDWQDYLCLGFEPDKTYRGPDGQLYHSPAYTIPYYHTGFELVTIQYRLFNPPTAGDRYRFHPGLGTSYYMTTPGSEIGEQAVICEGAKKAIVTRVYGGTDDYTVLAVPSKSDSGGVAEAVSECRRVYVLLDPDAGEAAHKLARAIGPQARIVTLPVKVDDALLDGMTSRELGAYLRQAV